MFGIVGVLPLIISLAGSMLMFVLCSLEPRSGEGFTACVQHQT